MASYPPSFHMPKRTPLAPSARQLHLDNRIGTLTQGGRAVPGIRQFLGVDLETASRLYKGEEAFTPGQVATLNAQRPGVTFNAELLCTKVEHPHQALDPILVEQQRRNEREAAQRKLAEDLGVPYTPTKPTALPTYTPPPEPLWPKRPARPQRHYVKQDKQAISFATLSSMLVGSLKVPQLTFVTWLQEKMEKADYNTALMARDAGINTATFTKIMGGKARCAPVHTRQMLNVLGIPESTAIAELKARMEELPPENPPQA